MIRSLLVIIAVVALVVDGAAQRTLTVFQRSAPKGEQVLQQGAVRVNEAAVRSLVRTGERAVKMSLPMPDGAEVALSLVRTHIVAPGARQTVMTDNGPVHSALGDGLAWYRAEMPDGGVAVFTFSASGEVSGLVNMEKGRYLVGRQFRGQGSDSYVVMRDHDAPYSCGTPVESLSKQLDQLISEAHRSVKDLGERQQADDTVVIELAIEADYDLKQGFETVQRTSAYITQLVAVMSTVYEKELGVRMAISNVRIWETPNDPYPEEMSVFELLEVFVNEYRTNMTSVARDMAVFLTSRGGQGGIARTIGGICQEDGSYCAGDVLRYVSNYPTWSWDVGMMVHEIGHVCGGIHTQSCYWPQGPLDSCVASESGQCVTQDQTAPARGTIMSYCHQQKPNGAVMTLEFHPLHRTVLKSFIRSAACLGNAPQPQQCTLTGVVRDAITKQPLAGVELNIEPIEDEIYRQTPPTSGDTTVQTDGNGRFTFNGLGYGLYQIVVPAPYTTYPITLSDPTSTMGVMIADTLVQFDLVVVKGRTVELVISNDGDTTPVQINIFSEQLPGAYDYTTLPVSEAGDTAIVVQRAIPIGRYIVVPSAIGRSFVPNKVVVDVLVGEDPLLVRFESSSTLPQLTSTLALGVGDRVVIGKEPTIGLTGGMPYTMKNTTTNEVVKSGIIPDDGVVVIEGAESAAYFSIMPQIDTSQNAPYLENTWVYPQYGVTAAMYLLQPRRMPLLAREYNMSALVTGFEPLADPIILRDRSMVTPRPSEVTLPFPLQISDRTFSSMSVAKNGFVVLDGEPFQNWVTNPLARLENAQLIIAAFAAELNPDTTAPAPWRIAWKLYNEAPNRMIAIEWRNFTIRKFDWETGQAFDIGRFSFQIRIHEGGRIDIVYDKAENLTEAITAQTGLRGNDILDNQAVLSLSENNLLDVRATYIPGGYQQISMLDGSGMVKGLTYRWDIGATSVESDESSKIRVSPTPSADVVEIHGVEGEASVRIVDLLGQTLLSKDVQQDAARIDVQGLATGRYVLLVTSHGKPHSIPLVIRR